MARCPLQTTSHHSCSRLCGGSVVLGLAEWEEDEDEPFGKARGGRGGSKALATCLHLH